MPTFPNRSAKRKVMVCHCPWLVKGKKVAEVISLLLNNGGSALGALSTLSLAVALARKSRRASDVDGVVPPSTDDPIVVEGGAVTLGAVRSTTRKLQSEFVDTPKRSVVVRVR